MTEDQAREKWCPFSRTGLRTGQGGVAVNRHVTDGDSEPEIYDETRCIASDCMAWRSRGVGGYCGLAGDAVQ